jgi:hypothetical protein
VLAWVGIGRRVLIEAEIVAAAGVLAEVVVAGDAGVRDGLAVVGAAGGTVAGVVVVVGTRSTADFSRRLR